MEYIREMLLRQRTALGRLMLGGGSAEEPKAAAASPARRRRSVSISPAVRCSSTSAPSANTRSP